jgi:heavy metal efflux system protein
MKSLLKLLTIWLLSIAKIKGQTSITLAQAIEIGTKNNFQIQAKALEVVKQVDLKPTAFELPKTNINATLGQFNAKAFDQNYTIIQTFNPFIFQAKKALINEAIKGQELKLASTKHEIVYQIRQSWNTISYLTALNKVFLKQEPLLAQFLKGTNVKLKTGEGTLLDNINAETKQYDLIQTRKLNELSIYNEKIKLRAILNLNEDFTLAETEFLPLELIFTENELNQNPILANALQEIKKAEANKNYEKATNKPEFSAGYFLVSITGNQEIDNKTVYFNGKPRFQGVSLGINLPLSGKAKNAKIKAAETELLIQQKNAEYLKNELNSRLLQQLEEQKLHKAQIEYYTKTALGYAEIINEKSQKAFLNAEIGQLEYLQSIETGLNIQQKYLDAINQYNQNNFNIQYLMNK